MATPLPWMERMDSLPLEPSLRASILHLSGLLQVLAAERGLYPAKHLFDHLVTEAADPATDVHWWETALDFVRKAALGTAQEAPVREAVRDLEARLSAHLGPYEEVHLEPITADTVWNLCLLSDTLTEPRRTFVAPNAYSLAQAHFAPKTIFRAILAGKAPIGFAMLIDDEDKPEYYLWRFMLAEPFHGRGLGRKAMDRLVEYVSSRPRATEFTLSCGQGEGSPEGFYRRYGFEPTGAVEDGEIVMRLRLPRAPQHP